MAATTAGDPQRHGDRNNVNPAKGVANGRLLSLRGKTVSPLMTAADKLPAANTTPLTAQSARSPVRRWSRQMPAATSANAVRCCRRTHQRHAPQQVVTTIRRKNAGVEAISQPAYRHLLAVTGCTARRSACTRKSWDRCRFPCACSRIRRRSISSANMPPHSSRHGAGHAAAACRDGGVGYSAWPANVSAEGQQFAAGEQGQSASRDEHVSPKGKSSRLKRRSYRLC